MKHLKKFESIDQDEILDHFIDLVDNGVDVIMKSSFVMFNLIKFTRNDRGTFGLKKSDIIEIMNSCIRLNSYYEVKDFTLEVDDEIGFSEEHFSVKNPELLVEFLDGVSENYYVVYVSVGKF